MPKVSCRIELLILLFALFCGFSASAQTGRITGHVTDQQSAVIPGASVQVLSEDSTIKRDVKTDGEGSYSVLYLPSGNYRVLIQAPGFGSAASEMITLSAGQVLVYNAQLSIATEKSEVVVSSGADTSGVELTTPSISTTMPSKEVQGYGLNGRNFLQLASTAPGVSNQTGQDEAKVGVAGSAKFSVNGGRVEYNTFEVDGSDVLNTSINVSRGQGEPLIVYPSIDSIDEMKILTANYSAVYGKSASGSVLVTTKSGSPSFHGGAYEFLRNEVFNARNYFDQPIQEPNGLLKKRTPLYRRQDFGFTLGGPLFIPKAYNTKKDKTFFFFSEEARLEKTPVDFNQAVPTEAERQGNFSDVCPIYIPGNNQNFNPAAYPDCPHAPNGSLSLLPSRTVTVNYTSQAILNSGIIPEPNATFGCNSTNPTALPHCYNAAISPATYWREELFRIDHDLNPSQRISFRYIHDAWNTTTLTPQWGVVQNSFATVENQLDGPGLDMIGSLAQTLPHGFFNRIVLGYSVEHITLAPQDGPGLSSLSRPPILDNPGSVHVQGWTPVPGNSACGTITGPQPSFGGPQVITGCAMGYIFNNGFGDNKMPGMAFQGTNGAYGGHGFFADTGYAPWKQDNPTITLRDDVNKMLGKHNLQFGGEASYVRQNELSAVSGANSGDLQGLLTFSNQQSLYTTGNAFADFLAGPGLYPLIVNNGQSTLQGGYEQTGIKSYTQDSGQGEYDNRYKMAEFYLQDDWKISSRLTINLGFRGSFFGMWYNPRDTAYNWRPEAYNATLGASIYVDPTNGYLLYKTAYGNGSPGTPVPLPNRTGPYSLNNLDPTITNGLVQCGVNGVPQSCMTGRAFHPAPRIGFAWDPFGDGKTAIRGGYGLFWEHGTGYEANVGSLIGSAPLVLSETESNIPVNAGNSNISGYNLIGLSCQGGQLQCDNLANTATSVTYPLNVTSIPTKAVYSYTQQWSLSIQRELRKNVIGQIAYVGTKGTHLTAVNDLNQLPPLSSGLNPFTPGQPITSAVCSSGATYNYFSTAGSNPYPPSGPGIPNSPGIGSSSPGYINMVVACTGNPGFVSPIGNLLGISADSVRPYPGFSNIISVNNIAVSQYHSFQSTLREITGPVTIAAAYTYSHSLDDASDRSSANFANSLSLKSNYASSDYDQRHMLNLSYQYDLPLVKLIEGFGHLSGSLPSDENETASSKDGYLPTDWKNALNGWELTGITIWQTGTPFSVINGGGSGGTGAADNAGVGDGLGIGSYVDVIGGARGIKPVVSSTGANIGPLLFNPNAFAAPRGLTFGNSGRNFLNNPTRTNFNISLFKHFKPLKERMDVEFRAEAYNIFNHTQFRVYDPSHPGNTGNNIANCYGDISTFYSAGASSCLVGNSFLHPVDAHDPRILQFGLKAAF